MNFEFRLKLEFQILNYFEIQNWKFELKFRVLNYFKIQNS